MPVSVNTKTYTFTNGTANDATPVNSEFTTLFNNTATLADGINDLADGSTPFTGQVDMQAGLKTDTITEHTNGVGVTIDKTLKATERINLARTDDPSGLADGDAWVNTTSDLLKVRLNGTTKTVAMVGDVATMPKGYLNDVCPVWQSSSTVRVPAGFRCRDDSDSADIVVTSNLDVVLSASGALGLDTGSEASGAFYRLWVCKGDSGVTAVASTSLTSPTLPSGYNTYKRLLPGAWRNDASSNIIPAYYTNFGIRAEMRYRCLMAGYGQTVGGTNILDGGTSGSYSSFADLTNAPNFIPAESQLGIFKVDSVGNNYAVALRPNGYTTDDFWARAATATNNFIQDLAYIPTDSSQLVEMKTSTGDGVDIAVAGYVVTQYTNGL